MSQRKSTPVQPVQQKQSSSAAVQEHDRQSEGSSKRTPSVTSEPQLGLQTAEARSQPLSSSAPSTRTFDRVQSNLQDPKLFPTGMDEVTPPSNVLKECTGRNKRNFGASSMFPYGETHSPPPRYAVSDYLTQRAQLSPTALEDFTEPEPIVSHLLDLFWTYQASHLLVVDRQLFLKHRQLARDGDGVGDCNFYTPCRLYTILALASMISTDKGVKRYSAGSGNSPGDSFNQRARMLFDIEIETPTLTTVQAAILLGARYGTFVDNCLGWTFSGVAFRMATKLGLHLDCSKIVEMGHMSEETARCRQITFWGCYVEDKLFSAYCQRPTMLMDWDITIERPGDQADAVPYMSSHLLPWTVSLNKLCGEILLGLYAQRHYNDHDSGLKRIASRIHKELWEWQHSIPSDLSWPVTKDMAKAPPFVLVLHMQFYYNLILLHRPFLEFSRVRREITQGRNGATTSTSTCTIAAANITRLVRDYRENYDIRQTSPNTVHITFIAATIHLINFRFTNAEPHGQLLRDCIPALSELGDSYPIANKALSILSTLIDRFDPLDDTQDEQCGEPSREISPENTRIGNQQEHGNDRSNFDDKNNWQIPPGNSNPTLSNTHQSPPWPAFWPYEAEPCNPHNWDEPLEVPPLIDLEYMPDVTGDLGGQNNDATGIYSAHDWALPLPIDSQSYNERPTSWFYDGCLPTMGIGLGNNGLDADKRSLFNAFYGKPNGLN